MSQAEIQRQIQELQRMQIVAGHELRGSGFWARVLLVLDLPRRGIAPDSGASLYLFFPIDGVAAVGEAFSAIETGKLKPPPP
ncbi:hypothetical protein ACFX13_034459 [Malus domestica]